MPKIVDHDKRRQEVLAATWRVIARVGLDEATTRRIAEEAGYSNGVLAHYFKDKDDILASALRLAHTHVRARMDALDGHGPGLAMLRAVVEEALPLDRHRLLEARIEFSFLGRALSAPKLQAIHATEIAHFRGALLGHVEQARATGQLDGDLTDDDVVDQILVLVDGLSIQALLAPQRISPQLQLRQLDLLFARIAARPAGRRASALRKRAGVA